MVEIGLMICCFVIASKFRKAGEKGASKYILGILAAIIGGAVIGGGLFAAGGARNPAIVWVTLGLGYITAIVIAIIGIKTGNYYLRNLQKLEEAKASKTAQELEILKQEMAGLKKMAAPAAELTPTNPQFSSNRPLSSLLRIFIFTSGNGQTVLECPVAGGILADTAGAPLNEILGKVPFDIIAGTDVGKQIIQSGRFPDSAWTAMNKIAPDDAAKAQMGLYRVTVRPFENPNTKESGVFVLLYQN